MTWTQDPDPAITRWLDGQAPRHAPAGLLEATRARVHGTRQRRIVRGGPAVPPMSNAVKLALVAAALVAATAVGIGIGVGTKDEPSPQPGLVVTAAPVTPGPISSGRVYPWPGTTPRPAGRYAFDVRSGGDKWMHRVSEGSSVEMVFEAIPHEGPLPSGAPVMIAGYPGTMTESPTAWNGRGIYTYRYVADMADGRFSITIIQREDTSDADLARARAVVESIRHEPRPDGSCCRLTFLLDDQWDSG